MMMLAAAALLPPAGAGPVEIYREGAKFCPRDRPASTPPISTDEAIERARRLLPADFCGPTFFVDGCEFDAEEALGSWRVFAHQYREGGGRRMRGGLEHSYVVLDRVGNCLANIPGTEFGAAR